MVVEVHFHPFGLSGCRNRPFRYRHLPHPSTAEKRLNLCVFLSRLALSSGLSLCPSRLRLVGQQRLPNDPRLGRCLVQNTACRGLRSDVVVRRRRLLYCYHRRAFFLFFVVLKVFVCLFCKLIGLSSFLLSRQREEKRKPCEVDSPASEGERLLLIFFNVVGARYESLLCLCIAEHILHAAALLDLLQGRFALFHLPRELFRRRRVRAKYVDTEGRCRDM
jgi:hypothetical protein